MKSTARRYSIRWWRETYADGRFCIQGIRSPWGGIVDETECPCRHCVAHVAALRAHLVAVHARAGSAQPQRANEPGGASPFWLGAGTSLELTSSNTPERNHQS
jgi:hypothetical protein